MAAAVLTACISICTPPVSAKENDVSLKRFDDRIEVRLNGKPLTSFQFNAKWEKPFLYPIATASGLILSRGYPIETREGEEKDHPWHRGIWYGHGDISKEDFWREKPDKTTSRLVMSGAPQLSGNSLEVVLAMQSSKDRRMGTIRERYAFSQDAQNVFIDSTITIAADAGEALTFGDTDDGGFGFRLSDDFREERGAELMNSDGLIGTKAIWGKPSRWVHYSATTGGKRAGVAVLDHPANLRHPSRWHARGYSLCSANPFALASFTKDKTADGSYTLPAGKSMTFRYRVIIHDGDVDRQKMDQYFSSFAKAQ